ncbi:unnamed protein product [Didymodactylos carnosus]|uniref:Uncharacterized protein n=1 Tax=Didymodactylos carnosus TaxID=1234261 RepID=A0A8S2RMC7_9BILA|nr:unnamed protein product [Didymodactylos carnosus]CAF4169969.1 unnamed protein product [Didymodactylos carnosus]
MKLRQRVDPNGYYARLNRGQINLNYRYVAEQQCVRSRRHLPAIQNELHNVAQRILLRLMKGGRNDYVSATGRETISRSHCAYLRRIYQVSKHTNWILPFEYYLLVLNRIQALDIRFNVNEKPGYNFTTSEGRRMNVPGECTFGVSFVNLNVYD